MVQRGRPTRDDVARLAGTSSAVVSYVVNDGPRRVRPETRARVQAAIEQLGYEPNRLARALRSAHSNLLGLLLPAIAIPFFTQLRQALEDAAVERGYLPLVGYTGLDDDRERQFADALAGLRVEGLIVVSAAPAGQGRSSAGIPVVYLHRAPARRGIDAVSVDNELVGYLATKHLLGHGFAAVACLGSDEDGPLRDRMAGWRRALSEAGVAASSRLLRVCEPDRGLAQGAMRAWLADDRPPRAVFAVSDEHAIGVLSAAQAEGRFVPGGLAVVGADGVREGEYTIPSLTTVELPIGAMARAAIDLLVAGRSEPRRVDLTDQVRLVARESCGCGAHWSR